MIQLSKDELLNILKNSKNLAFFLGAGISYNSGLPLAKEFKMKIAKNFLEILKKYKINIEIIIKNFEIFENCPFELFFDLLSNIFNINDLLEIFGDYYEPNTNHLLVAKLAKLGYTTHIITTNFDLLIEKALKYESIDYTVIYNEYDLRDFKKLENLLLNVDSRVMIFKIHGCASNIDSIKIALSKVASKNMSLAVKNAIRYLYKHSPADVILVMGYSFSDIYDIIPAFKSLRRDIIKSNKKLIVIDYNGSILDDNSKRNLISKINGFIFPVDSDKINKYGIKYNDLIKLIWFTYINEPIPEDKIQKTDRWNKILCKWFESKIKPDEECISKILLFFGQLFHYLSESKLAYRIYKQVYKYSKDKLMKN